eukprot:2491464-Amphidinium_carterae.1
MASPALTEPPPLYSLRRHDLRLAKVFTLLADIPIGTSSVCMEDTWNPKLHQVALDIHSFIPIGTVR